MKNNRKNYFIITAIIIMVVMGIAFIKFGLNFGNNTKSIYNYTAQKTDNYEVILKPNNFYETEKLPSGGYYASKSIKAYSIDLNYNFKADKQADLNYNYNVVATLVGTVKNKENQDEEVWNRNFILYDNTINSEENIEQFFINKQVNIDYEYYNNLARAYEKAYDITIDAVLKVRFNISYTINIDKTSKEVEDFIELDIPITSSVTEVNENYENTTSQSIFPEAENNESHMIIFCAIGVLLIIGAIVIFILKVNKKTPEEKYKCKIKRILKYYKDVIVTVNNEPDLSNMKIMNISNLNDLIDVAEQNQSNIIYYQTPDNKKSNFYVIVGKYVYTYTI